MTAAVLQRGGWILWIFLPFLRRLEACLRVCVVLRLYKVDRSHSCRDATRLCLSAQPWKRFRCLCDVSVTMCPLELALIPVSAGARGSAVSPHVHRGRRQGKGTALQFSLIAPYLRSSAALISSALLHVCAFVLHM